MSQRTLLGRSTAGCTILYLIKEMKPKILSFPMLWYSNLDGVIFVKGWGRWGQFIMRGVG